MTIDAQRAVSRRLDRLANQQRIDFRLQQLLLLVQNTHLSFPIGLVVDGVVIRGALTEPARFAEAIDDALKTLFLQVQGDDVWTGYFAESAMRLAVEAKEATDQIQEKYDTETNLDTIEEADWESYQKATAFFSGFAVTNAQALVQGAWTTVGRMWVSVAHVAAWWPLEDEEGVSVHYNITAPPVSESTR